ncbi:hypothetical protein C2845_PM11G03580 [Panicum miliaceum]|uniref:Uncharacterized protein n=1 Tax=Panicum miliaceum TaxID=4540 RepID=A0A3L6RWT7_PANMI|nr:hypothetical protein C2845_PM11G03580 [Panicum miliaceum]
MSSPPIIGRRRGRRIRMRSRQSHGSNRHCNRVLYADGRDLPIVLNRFLIEEDHIFTGAHIENDVKRLQDDFDITISNPTDLQLVVPEAAPRYEYLRGPHPLYGVRRSSLEKIARAVLCLPRLHKPEGADHDN